MNVISRHCINPAIQIHQFDELELKKTHDYQGFCMLINRWKLLLVDKYDAKPGQTCLIDFTAIGVFYYAAIFAATELGLILVVDIPHCYNDADIQSYKVNLHGKLDFIITHEGKYNPENAWYFEFDCKRNEHLGRNVVFQRELTDYVPKNAELLHTISDMILCNPKDPVVYACSSGTTGLPKRLIDSHEKVYLMARRLGKYLGFESTDKVLHTRNIHHGASMCYHFLPGFMIGREQFDPGFTFEELNLDCIAKLVTLIDRYEINQLFLYRPEFLFNYLSTTAPVKHKVKVTTLYHITLEVARLIKEKNIKFINSPFGDTTIGLGFFIKTVDANTPLDNYVVGNMGPQLDDNFFECEVRDLKLYVSCPSIGQDWKTSNDKFELINGNFVFEGRADQYRIGDEWIDFDTMEKEVKRIFKGSATASIDFEMQKLYLSVWKENREAEEEFNQYLRETYEAVNVAHVLRNQNVKEFFNGRKIDLSKIRDYCRAELGLSL